MTDPNVNPDPTTTSSFENAAIDPAAARAAQEGGDGPPRSPRATDENPTIDQEIGMVANALEREVAEQKEKYLRLYAEFDNFRKRTERERREFAEWAAAELIGDELAVVDDFDRALGVASPPEAAKPWAMLPQLNNRRAGTSTRAASMRAR